MDFDKVYKSTDADILRTPYIMDDEELEHNCWDFEAMKAQIKSWDEERAISDDDEYLDILEANSLKEWWDDHYDPKGIAFSMSYHSSILEDVNSMITDYGKTTKHWVRTPLGNIERDDSFADDNEAIVIINVEGPLQEEDGAEQFEENVLYFYEGAPIKSAYYDEDSGTFIMIWDRDVLKTYL